jgi:hypothetical protein
MAENALTDSTVNPEAPLFEGLPEQTADHSQSQEEGIAIGTFGDEPLVTSEASSTEAAAAGETTQTTITEPEAGNETATSSKDEGPLTGEEVGKFLGEVLGPSAIQLPPELTSDQESEMTSDQIDIYNLKRAQELQRQKAETVERSQQSALLHQVIERNSKAYGVSSKEILQGMRTTGTINPEIMARSLAYDKSVKKAADEGANKALKTVKPVVNPATAPQAQGRLPKAPGRYHTRESAVAGGIAILQGMREGNG